MKCLKGMALSKLLDKVLAKRKRFSIAGKLITNVSVLHMTNVEEYEWSLEESDPSKFVDHWYFSVISWRNRVYRGTYHIEENILYIQWDWYNQTQLYWRLKGYRDKDNICCKDKSFCTFND